MSALVYDIGVLFRGLYSVFRKVAGYVVYIPIVGSELESFFYSAADASWDIYYRFYRFSLVLEDWEDYVKSAIASLHNLTEYVWGKLSDTVENVFDAVQNLHERVLWLVSELEELPSLIGDWLDDHRRTLWNLIRDYVEDFGERLTGTTSDLFQAVRDYVNSQIELTLAAIAAPINLVNQWYEDIENFFNDPWAWLWIKLDSFVERYW